MALFDLQPVDLSNGDRLLPFTPINIRVVSDKQLPTDQNCVETEASFRKTFKTSQIVVPPAQYEEVTHELEHRKASFPGPFIKTEQKTPEQMEQTLEYDLDEEDRVWLEEENKKRAVKKSKKIKDEMFELTIDRLEKETYFKNAPHENETNSMDGSEHLDEDCCICGNGDVENLNQIIYCDMCNIAVHQDCYGVPYIPEGQWLCRKCKLSPMESVTCELCPLRDGAFKQTADGKWAHVACAIWLNEVHFGNTAFLEPIEGVQNSLRRRQKLRCLVCKVKGGACLQCSKGSCVKSFHVTCAMQARLQMVVDAVPDDNSPDGLTVKRFVYCHVHGSVAVGDNEFAKNKKRAVEAIHRARRRMLNNACTVSAAPVPTVDAEAKKRIEEKVDKNILEDIMGFWFYKRKKRFGLPLIRRLQVKKKVVTREPTLRGEAARKGRIVYEKARILVELMQKREKNYLETIIMDKKIVPTLLTPLEDVLVEFIKSLLPIDDAKFFHEDPLKQGLQNYSSIIRKPMDLGTMKRNAVKGLYKTEAEMKEHLDLVFKNCLLFNKSNEGVCAYAIDRQERMNQAYSDLVEYIKYTRTCLEEYLEGEPEKKKVKEETNETQRDTQKELRDGPAHREEPNRRKRKADTLKEEEPPETPSVKRDKRTRDRDKEKEKDTPKPVSTCSIFSSGISPCTPSTVNRRFSLDAVNTPRLDSNCNKSQRKMLTRGSTQSSFNLYRDVPSVLSPEMGVTSCDSAVESDMEMARPESRSYSRPSLSDRNSLHHGDLVKVNGKTGRVVIMTEGLLDNPQLSVVCRELEPKNGILVRHFRSESKGGEYARYDPSCVALLNINTDKVEGIREAREYHNRMICSK